MNRRRSSVVSEFPPPARHIPVMLPEVLACLLSDPCGIYVDATFGGGGYTHAILEALPRCKVVAFDRDATAVVSGQKALASFGDRLSLIHAPFSELETHLVNAGLTVGATVQGLVADLGLSSLQLSRPERGFSFLRQGPLDMRFDTSHGETAGQLLARLTENEIALLIRTLGGEPRAKRVARAICKEQPDRGFESTEELASCIERAVPRRSGERLHPATRTFQALRIAVNDELNQLRTLLPQALSRLAVGGRLVMVSFHSLEDRLVKSFGRQYAGGSPEATSPEEEISDPSPAMSNIRLRRIQGHPMTPTARETEANPRARSARMRAFEVGTCP